MAFRSRIYRTLDPKGRLMLPPEYRQYLEEAGKSRLDPYDQGTMSDDQLIADILTTSSHSSRRSGPGSHLVPPPMAGETPSEPLADGSVPAAQFTLTTYDGCLVAYLWDDWQELEEKFMRIVNPSAQVRDFRRLVLGGAEIHVPDGQGRIRLSQDHREYAGIEKDVVLIGMITRFEIWNPTVFKEKMKVQTARDTSKELGDTGMGFYM